MPKLTPITPTRVRSPRSPETGNLAPCRKSMPASILTEPGGMMSTSSVINGRCCACARVAKQSNNATAEASAGANLSNRGCEIMRSDSNPRLQERQIIVYLRAAEHAVLCPALGFVSQGNEDVHQLLPENRSFPTLRPEIPSAFPHFPR